MPINPIALSRLARRCHPLTLTVPQSHAVVAPVDAIGADVAAPPVIHVVLELALVNEVVALATQALHASVLVDLSECTLCVVLADPQVVIDWTMRWGIANNILGIQHA